MCVSSKNVVSRTTFCSVFLIKSTSYWRSYWIDWCLWNSQSPVPRLSQLYWNDTALGSGPVSISWVEAMAVVPKCSQAFPAVWFRIQLVLSLQALCSACACLILRISAFRTVAQWPIRFPCVLTVLSSFCGFPWDAAPQSVELPWSYSPGLYKPSTNIPLHSDVKYFFPIYISWFSVT